MSSKYSLLFLLYMLRVEAFFPNRLAVVPLGDNTWTHDDITEQGVLRAVAAYFEANNTVFSERALSRRSNLTASYLFRQFYGGKYVTISRYKLRDLLVPKFIMYRNMHTTQVTVLV